MLSVAYTPALFQRCVISVWHANGFLGSDSAVANVCCLLADSSGENVLQTYSKHKTFV